jgi:hypothetical protein
MILKAS